MPIDYSKFDNIGSDDEDDVKAAPVAKRGDAGGGTDFTKLMQCLQELGKAEDAGKGAGKGSSRPMGGFDDDALGLGLGMDPSSWGGGLDGGAGSQRALDMQALRSDAWHHLVQRLVSRPEAASIGRALLLEAEVHMIGSRYRQAMVVALALKHLIEDDTGLDAEWLPSVEVIEMVASYQLGDSDRAVELRDRLNKVDGSNLSDHLRSRFEGTSEVLDLVPQFLDLMRAAEAEDKAGGSGAGRGGALADERAAAALAGLRR